MSSETIAIRRELREDPEVSLDDSNLVETIDSSGLSEMFSDTSSSQSFHGFSDVNDGITAENMGITVENLPITNDHVSENIIKGREVCLGTLQRGTDLVLLTPSSEKKGNENLAYETVMVRVEPSSRFNVNEKMSNAKINSTKDILDKESVLSSGIEKEGLQTEVNLIDLMNLMKIQLKQNLEIKNEITLQKEEIISQKEEITIQIISQKEEILKKFQDVTNKLDSRLGVVEANTVSLGAEILQIKNTLGDLQRKDEGVQQTIENFKQLITDEVAKNEMANEKSREVDTRVTDITTDIIHLKTQVNDNLEDFGVVSLTVKGTSEQVALLIAKEQIHKTKMDVYEQKLWDVQNSLEAKVQSLETEINVNNLVMDDKVEKNHSKINNLTKLISADKDSIAEVIQNLVSPVSTQLAPLTAQIAQMDRVHTDNTKIMSNDITALVGNQGTMYTRLQEVEGVLKKQTLELNKGNGDRDTKQTECEQSLKKCWTQVMELQRKFSDIHKQDINQNEAMKQVNTMHFAELSQKDNCSVALSIGEHKVEVTKGNDSNHAVSENTINSSNGLVGKGDITIGSDISTQRKVLTEQTLRQLPALCTSLILDRAHQDRVPHYNGENMPAPQFLRKLEEYLHRSGVVDDVDKIELFPTVLFGKPQRWWGLSNAKYTSWEDLKENFLKLYFSDYDRNRYEKEWLELKSSDLRDIENMAVTGIQLQLILKERDSFEKICERVTQKLPPVLADFMLLQKFHTVEEYLIGLRETMRLKNYVNGVKVGEDRQNRSKGLYSNQGFNNNNNQGYNGYQGYTTKDDHGKLNKQQFNQQMQNSGTPMKGVTGTPPVINPGNNTTTTSSNDPKYDIPGVSKNYRGNNPIPYFKRSNPGVSAISQNSYSPNHSVTERFAMELLEVIKKMSGQNPINESPPLSQIFTSEDSPVGDNVESDNLNV